MFSYDEAFSRNLGWVTAEEQQVLRGKRVAIGGLGGTGGIHLLTLCRLGIGRFNIADFDAFSLANFNRQAGAMMSTLDKPKAEVLRAMALDINPELDIRVFPKGVDRGNVDDFLRDVDVYVDALDYFAFDARKIVYDKLAELGIPATIVAPMGMGAAMINFLPGGPTFEEFFQLEGLPDKEQALRFLIGLSPAVLQRTYLADPSRVKFGERAGPSTGMACQLCAGVAGTEVLKILLKRGKVYGAPWGVHFDAYRNKLVKTWRPGGSSNPLQKLMMALVRHKLRRAGQG
jgi:molybdopterin/thiamine biosynthesis adenylyltransferase